MAEPTASHVALANVLVDFTADGDHAEAQRRIAQALADARVAALESVLDILAHDPEQSRQGQAALVRVIGRVIALRDGKKPTLAAVLDFCEERRNCAPKGTT